MALHSVMYVWRCIVRCVRPPPPPPHVNYTSDVRVYLCYTRVIESIVKSVEKATPASSSRRRVRQDGRAEPGSRAQARDEKSYPLFSTKLLRGPTTLHFEREVPLFTNGSSPNLNWRFSWGSAQKWRGLGGFAPHRGFRGGPQSRKIVIFGGFSPPAPKR